ncbi:MAG TPA: hypothetical protein VH092_12475 [Urbifossiella sp.]|jgi:hypothetical protein|nr:hypothetical protein [Urbifossiella sp.]
MNGRRSRPATPRPRTTGPSNLLLQTSTAGWYAAWKAQKTAAPVPTTEPETAPKNSDDSAEAVARWLTGGSGR